MDAMMPMRAASVIELIVSLLSSLEIVFYYFVGTYSYVNVYHVLGYVPKSI